MDAASNARTAATSWEINQTRVAFMPAEQTRVSCRNAVTSTFIAARSIVGFLAKYALAITPMQSFSVYGVLLETPLASERKAES